MTSVVRSVARRATSVAAAFSLLAFTGPPARAQVGYGTGGNSVSSARVQPNSTFNTTVQQVYPNGTILLGNGLTVTLGGMSPFGGGSWGSTVQGGGDFAGYLSPMLVGQSVRVTTLPIGHDQPSAGAVPVLMYYGAGYGSLANQAAVQRGLARYQSQYFQASPEVREQMRQAEIDAKNNAYGGWGGPGSGTMLETLPPDEQRKRVQEHNKRVEQAQKKAAAEAAKAPAADPPPAPDAPVAPEAPAQ
ncbi:MAG: hypothetical protein IPK07_30180 [Deltaproteobacteria bacterium]|nr:hypothetical protein [Deltaproteobacteria bacterium]